jgi:hypothetical protein
MCPAVVGPGHGDQKAVGATGSGDITAGGRVGSSWGTAGPEKSVVNVADTPAFAFIATVQLSIPLQAPPHPARPHALLGVALKVTCVPQGKLALQVEPQSIAAGELTTLPPGLPTMDTERVLITPLSWKTVPHALALL